MPKGVVKGTKQEKIWNYKKRQVEKQTGKKSSQFTDQEWRRVNFLYQKAKKKYKGKLPKKYTPTSASFIETVLASYTIVVAISTSLDKLQSELKNAAHHVDILCRTFDVCFNPPYLNIVDKITKTIKQWESSDHITKLEEIDQPFLVYHYKRPALSKMDEKDTSLSDDDDDILKQFHDNFLHIVTTMVIPAIKAYVQKNPAIDIKTFKPLLSIII